MSYGYPIYSHIEVGVACAVIMEAVTVAAAVTVEPDDILPRCHRRRYLLPLPHLQVTKGSIINMSRCTAQLGQKGNAVYAATKGAVNAFTKSLALEEAAHGVRVNAVLPGSIYTDSRRRFIESQSEQGLETERLAESLQPMGRSGTPQEASRVVLFLASEAASFLAGVELLISGGIELGMGIKHPWLLV